MIHSNSDQDIKVTDFSTIAYNDEDNYVSLAKKIVTFIKENKLGIVPISGDSMAQILDKIISLVDENEKQKTQIEDCQEYIKFLESKVLGLQEKVSKIMLT